MQRAKCSAFTYFHLLNKKEAWEEKPKHWDLYCVWTPVPFPGLAPLLPPPVSAKEYYVQAFYDGQMGDCFYRSNGEWSVGTWVRTCCLCMDSGLARWACIGDSLQTQSCRRNSFNNHKSILWLIWRKIESLSLKSRQGAVAWVHPRNAQLVPAVPTGKMHCTSFEFGWNVACLTVWYTQSQRWK